MNTLLSVQNLSKKFGKKEVVSQVSFQLQAGEVVGLIGPNGAGKTTIIKMLMGYLLPNQGKIEVLGKDLHRHIAYAKSKMGAIVENPDFYLHLTGLQNLQLAARLYKRLDTKRLQQIIELVGLEHRIKDKVKTYSLGMKQRLGLAHSLLHDPSILILDEPTNGLDPAGILEMRNLLKTLAHQEQKTVLISSHLLSEMQLVCDRALFLQQGRLVRNEFLSEQFLTASFKRYRIETNQVEALAALLAPHFADTRISSDQKAVEFSVEREELSRVLRHILTNQIAIYSVIPMSNNLEEVFLQVTGGNEIV